MRSLVFALGCVSIATGCIPLAWETDSSAASTFVATASSPKRDAGAGGGMSGFGGGTGFGGGMPGFGGGMPPIGGGGGAGGGADRPLEPRVTGTFAPGGFSFPTSSLRSSTLAAVPNTLQLVAVVDDADALYVLSQPNRRIPLPAGARPSSVAVAPDGLTAWVALRGLGSVARVVLATGQFVTVPVGAEPTGVALSPSGNTAVVATFGERTVSLVDTRSLGFTAVDVGGNPRALTITDDGDLDDSDESAWVTLFFGEPLAEGSDTGRRGVVVEVSLGSQSVVGRVTLAPINTGTGLCVPNQLTSIVQQGAFFYVSHVCASPAAPQGPRDSVFAAVSVISQATRSETPGNSRVVGAMSFSPSLMANPVDLASLNGAVVVLSQGANMVAPFNGTGFGVRAAVAPFYGMGPMFDDPAAGVPTGMLVSGPQIFVLDSTGRRVVQLPMLAPMVPITVWPFETLPPEGSPAYGERLGRRHFATAEGTWSSTSSVSCISCHPDGLTDGLTWVFGAGPRQTPSLAGTFERGRLSAHRAQNWTANADEISDVEGLVRSLAGGSGAIGVDGGSVPLANGYPGPGGVARHDGLSASSRDLVAATSPPDWLELEAWIAALPRPPSSPRLDVLAVGRGRQLFAQGGCAACHGAAQWTVSRVPYVPSFAKNGSAVGDNGLPALATGLRLEPRDGGALWNPALNTDTFKVAAESVLINNVSTLIGPERITCVLRDVGTFDRADPLEVKSNGQPAQGEKGFNPPSLFGLATSAPYLHHGQARTLAELFSPRYRAHHEAAVPGFLAAADAGVDEAQVRDLSAFLASIDETTLPFAVPFGSDVCFGY